MMVSDDIQLAVLELLAEPLRASLLLFDMFRDLCRPHELREDVRILAQVSHEQRLMCITT